MKIFSTPQYHNIDTRYNLQKQNIKNAVPIAENKVDSCKLFSMYYPDSLYFGAMKKSQFTGMDLASVNKFKAPIEKFDTNDDLQIWAGHRLDSEYSDKNLDGYDKDTKMQRKDMLAQWCGYTGKYSPTVQLLIMNDITKNLKPNNAKLPPILNNKVLDGTIDEINNKLKSDNKYAFDIDKLYQNKLRAFVLNDDNKTDAKWIRIPGKQNNPEHFEENIQKLQALSYKTWCTKNDKIGKYLQKGDVYIYVEKGSPKVAMCLTGDKVSEIQGARNNWQIPLNYLDTIDKHIDGNNFECEYPVQQELDDARIVRSKVKSIKKDLDKYIKKNDVKGMLKTLGYGVKKDWLDGLLTLDSYHQPSGNCSFEDLGIDENNMFKHIKKIKDDANFSDGSSLTNLGKLKYVGKNLYLINSKVNKIGDLKHVGNNIVYNAPLREEDFKDVEIDGEVLHTYDKPI